MKLPQYISDEIDASSHRMSKMSRSERTELLWSGLAIIYGVKRPTGVNPKRLKVYRKASSRNDIRQAKLTRLVNRCLQNDSRKDLDQIVELARNSPSVPDPELI